VSPTPTPFTATVLGYPRIGPNRELKKALERYWSGTAGRDELLRVADDLAKADRTSLTAAGLDSVPVNTFSFYDQMLDTTVLLGAVPPRYADVPDDLDRYFAMARGNAELSPLEMTKWFDTNYHYLVPEIGDDTTFALNPAKVLDDVKAALSEGVPARPVVIGPATFLLLAKSAADDPEATKPFSRLGELVPLYIELLGLLSAEGVGWVQLDEPALVLDRTDDELSAITDVYRQLAAATDRPAILVATYFGDASEVLPQLVEAGVEGIAVDLVAGSAPTAKLGDSLLVAGVVDGRNIWRTDPDKVLALLELVQGKAGAVAVSTSCSLLHVPYSLTAEPDLDDQLRSWLAFAEEKVAEVVALSTAVRGKPAEALDAARKAIADRSSTERVHRGHVKARLKDLPDTAFKRPEPGLRQMVHASRYQLPVLPTTTIGSFPQTGRVRQARAQLRKGVIDEAAYEAQMQEEIREVIALQEDIGLDVLVHGEPERNDMVQYFAEQLDGFAATVNGWVQSYGSRCVRPPILYGDVQRPAPMTVTWARFAQSLTNKPVKGMLTGPVTILAWSFVRDDQPIADTAMQVALAIRDEAVDLEQAGIGVIQVDEPALRELLPPRRRDRAAYLNWAVRSFQLSTSGVSGGTSVHTHLCYSEFGEIIQSIADLGADVTSVEAARSHMELLDDLESVGYERGIGPGVYDIHSPRIPSEDEMADALRLALKAVPPSRLWVNPDCGLKTRKPDEVEPALRNMVAAAQRVRSEVSVRR
jgi:5-methyltetrahydropteroyltriglutamate--homocysteine methyltransferase